MNDAQKILKKPKTGIIAMIKFLLPLTFRHSPFLFVLSSFLFLLHGLSYVFIPASAAVFFDEAEKMAGSGAEVWVLLPPLALMASAYIFNQVIDGLSNFVTIEYFNKIGGLLSAAVHKKAGRIPAVNFEDNQQLDFINKAEAGKNEAVAFVIRAIVIMVFFYLSYFIFMGWYLFTVQPLLVIILAVVFMPSLVSMVIRARIFKEAEDKSAPIRREYEHYEQCLCTREFFMETRSLGAFEYFFNRCKKTLVNLNKISLKASAKSNLFELIMKTFTASGYVIILIMMYFMVVNGQMSVGAFVAVFASMDALYHLMAEVFNGQLPTLANGFGAIQNYINFINIPEQKGIDEEITINENIKFDNVSFSYPGAEQQAVKNVSFEVKARETIAIVGENGSGKTTLMRLLMGLYQPDSGCIMMDNKDISKYSLSAVGKNISAVFQKYGRYKMSLKDNIIISTAERYPDETAADQSSEMAGINMKDKNLSNGYDTMLSVEFDGTDVSGGQWQRIAIARGYYRKHSLIVLDEPTAAIDPLEETKIYERFAKMAKDKTAFIVTHRLGSVHQADRIFVMDKGKLVESGTHDELISNEAVYAQMYNMQRQRYV